MDKKEAYGTIEAILFAVGNSVEIETIATALDASKEEVLEYIDDMQTEYAKKNRGIQIVRLENSVQLRTKDDYYDALIKVTNVPKKQTLSDSAYEVLSIVAYKQPVTRMDVEKVRGVNSDHIINRLVELSLIEEKGRLNAPGKPIVFGTTEQFLRSFGVASLEELPEMSNDMIEEFKVEAEKEVEVNLKMDV